MIQPTTEQLQVLTGIERFWFRVANFVLRYLRPLSIVWNQIFMVHFSWIMTGRRVRRWGMEHTEVLGPDSCVIVVANHRSFFDFYVIGPILYTQTNLSKHILFPVRAPFFYDKWIGGIVNGIMSGFFMFPPVMRAKEKRTYNN
jgi:1-acyl-sn-glycerol-3-phosphate acyltransferase